MNATSIFTVEGGGGSVGCGGGERRGREEEDLQLSCGLKQPCSTQRSGKYTRTTL